MINEILWEFVNAWGIKDINEAVFDMDTSILRHICWRDLYAVVDKGDKSINKSELNLMNEIIVLS